MSKQKRRNIPASAAPPLTLNIDSTPRRARARQQQQSNSLAIVAPTAEEDRAITDAALNDPDALPLTDAQLRQMRPTR